MFRDIISVRKYVIITEKARSRNVTQYEKPIIDEIILLSGESFVDARLEIEAPRVPGFMAIESQRLKDSTEYIALTAISSLTIKNDELRKTSPAYYFSPELKVKVER